VFGTNNIIEETALVENTGPPGTVFEIGNDNLFEVGSVCRAQKVGDNNTFGVQCEIGEGVEISNGCSIGAKCKLLMKETLPPHTVIYGEQNQRRMAADNPLGLKSQTDFLRSSLTRYSKAIRNKE
jgi:dynactin-6